MLKRALEALAGRRRRDKSSSDSGSITPQRAKIEPLLVLEVGDFLDQPERLGVRAAGEKPASNSAATSPAAIGP